MKLLNYFGASFMLLLSSSTFGQTGPGGVGNSSNNVIWLNGNNYTFSASPKISTWNDQSGNGNDFSQATSTKQPRITNYADFTAIKFEGAQFITQNGIAGLNGNTNTHFVVYNGNRPDHKGVLFNGAFTQSNQFIRTARVNSNIRSWVLNSVGGVEDNLTTNSSTFQIVSSIWDGASQTYSSFKNGTSFGTSAGANGNPTGNYLNTVGASASGSLRFDGNIGEVIMYNSVLNSAQHNLVNNYLSSKYGVAVGTDLYSYDGTHKFDVFGIGEEADGNNLTGQGASIVELSIGSMSVGEYILAGHDNVNLGQTTNDVPATLSGGSRLTRVWRADVTGAPGNVDIVFDVSSLTLLPGSYYLLVESGNGVFNDGGVVEYGPFVDVGGLVTISNVLLTDGDYFTIASSVAGPIVSVKTGFWDIASTWSCNCVPGISDDATITSGHTVSARTSTNINDLTIDGTLNTFSTGVFNVKGDYLVNASGIVIHKTVTFNGTVQQNLTNNSSSTVNFPTVIINNSNNVLIQSGNFSVSNSVKASNGQFQNIGGSCTLLSNPTSTAVILNSNGGFSGEFILQRHISARNANWGDLSSPVSGLTLGQWDSDQTGTITEIYMSEVNGVDGSAAGFFSVYDWNEATQAYQTITDTNYVLPVGMGIEVWLADDATTWNAKTIDSRGTPNFGNIGVAVSNSWTLVGNPYHSFITWTSLTKPTLQSTYYIWNTNTGTYDAKTSGTIPPNQGFWVEGIGLGAGTLTFTESSKNGSGASTFYKMEEDLEPVEFIEAQLKIRSNNYSYSHALKIRLNNLASVENDQFDGSFKSSRLKEAPSITTYPSNSNRELAITSFNYQDEIIMPIKINVGVSGSHIIEPINFEAFENEFKFIELTDLLTGKIYDLKGYSKENIEVEIDENDDTERFSLRLSNNSSTIVASEIGDIQIYKTNENTIIDFNNVSDLYEVSVYNALGQKVLSTTNSNGENIVISNDKFPSGINIITIKSNNGTFSEKLNY